MVLANFQVEDKLGRAQFFQETFFVANTILKIILKMLFFTLNNANIQFVEKKLIWRFYTTAKALLTTKWVKLIDKKEFAKTMLDKDSKTLVIYVVALETPLAGMAIYPL